MRIRPHMLLLLSLFLACAAGAQDADLPKLGADPAIKSGRLPNGISWFFADNKSHKGLMDIAIVQKMDPSLGMDDLYGTARHRFARSGFGSEPVEIFLARNGVLPGDSGFIRCSKGSIRYHLDNVSSARGDAAQDSILFSLFNLLKVSAEENQPSSSQAIVFSGDFDHSRMLSKLNLFSILCNCVPGSVPEYGYVWDPGAGATNFRVEEKALAKVIVDWRMARTPDKYMATVLPVISDKLSGEMGWVLRNRLYPACRAAGLHVWIDYRHLNSTDGIGDERMSVSINCLRNVKEDVTRILETELNRLLTYGVDEVEYTYARDAYKYKWLADARGMMHPNSGYVHRCISHFLYGASLSTDQEKIKFAYRELPDSTQTRLFNNYVRQLLEQSSCVDTTLSAAPALVSRETVASAVGTRTPPYVLKFPKDKEEYISGGYFWTFANGVNLIYKKMDTKGMAYYCYAARGGREYADPDFFDTIDGVYPESFANYLAVNGIEMVPEFRPCDVRLKGRFPSEKMDEAMNVILAMTTQTDNEKVFGPGTYKIFVMVGDMDELAVKKMFCSYAVSLRPGGKWVSGKEVKQDETVVDVPDGVTAREINMALDESTYNLALSDMAYYALRDAMGVAFATHAAMVYIDHRFIGFPSGRYSIVYGASNLPVGHFSDSDEALTEEQINAISSRVLTVLGEKEVDAASLQAYRNLAKNAIESYSRTPEGIIEAVCNRYLDNKDLRSKYSTSADAVTAEAIRKFYASSFTPDR